MERQPLYAQFDGDEIDGKRYSLGDEIDSKVDAGTRAVLIDMGRLAASKPAVPFVTPVAVDKHVDDMTRAELVQSALAGVAAEMEQADDEELRRAVTRTREREEERREEADEEKRKANTNGSGKTAYADLKDKPLGSLKTEDLVTIAEEENVSLVDAKTNPDRVKAIEEVRAKAAG